jgi:hypothetical protein
MTEAEWLECTDAHKMLAFLRGKASKRKLRLFVCACCRSIWHLITDEAGRRAVETGERFADGHATDEERKAASTEVFDILGTLQQESGRWDRKFALLTAERAVLRWREDRDTCLKATEAADSAWQAAEASKSVNEAHRAILQSHLGGTIARPQQTAFLRDVFHPFRSVSPDPAWRTPAVLHLAQFIYEDRAFDQLPIPADALEEAGCTSQQLLDHCRSPGPHVRGCWAVDLVLGKG